MDKGEEGCPGPTLEYCSLKFRTIILPNNRNSQMITRFIVFSVLLGDRLFVA